MPADNRDIRTQTIADNPSGRPITRLQYRGWYVDVDAHVVSIPRQIITTQHLADLQACLAAAHAMARTNARTDVPPPADNPSPPTPTDALVTLLQSARSIAVNKWHPDNFDLYVCTRTAWAEAECDLPFTAVLNALRRGLPPGISLTDYSDNVRRCRDITALYDTAITALTSPTDAQGAA